ncbi:CheR family methyltransferase [Noviherbaspirillum aridicola]|uniref:Biofilm formation methyltransferase WspC n=1 Tax=Noviherbaspirillum aridicola TaxID=2849687 RepID=A0ABQ4Q482_9BURK|nr:protein-glutamate O-methyltransferase CheR [Noviherbaspirillum aridicola]GIZ52006.1 putative biofilm formation methyltransferase WspC [Noviherbaspirillum aridicola]
MSASRLLQVLRQRTGIDLTPASLQAAVRQRARTRRINDAAAYESEALRDEAELQALIDLVVVPESWFFRDEEAFAAAVRFLRERLADHGRTRALCVPCAAGEEPYSLAIALREAGIDGEACEIDALDISPQAIERARAGVYSRNAFRSRDLSFRGRHFSPAADGWRLHEEIRRRVRFACGSLLALSPPDPSLRYDLVFCRNLLIYFDAPTQALAAARLRGLLHDDGMLFAGYAETMPLSQHGFRLQPIARAFAMTKAAAVSEPRPRAIEQAFPRRRPPFPAVAPLAAPAMRTPLRRQDDAHDLLAQARALADRGAVREAQAACRRCLEQAPDVPEAWFLLGLLSEQQQDAAQAIHCLKRAVYLEPDHYEALCHLALLAERQGDQAQAQRCRRRAARVHDRLAAKQVNR